MSCAERFSTSVHGLLKECEKPFCMLCSNSSPHMTNSLLTGACYTAPAARIPIENPSSGQGSHLPVNRTDNFDSCVSTLYPTL